ncbi:hypothetical protein [Algoriphagus sediminis]|uniref:Uncharacterized protein n=1 Tax=Algoriphagus sediminis TaxID=3057113 RepID=A0ABT7YGA3_9BACT|nr:hypothetical protein [Algoriphagus sediminis]MDN3205527.1 hypothetical protein [Algoriphagus sediminis]
MIHDELQKLEKLATKIKGRMAELKSENEELKKLNSDLEGQLQAKEQEIEHFKNKIKISNIVDNRRMNSDDSTEMKDLIDNYIKEIDHLITHLSE